MKDRRPTTEEMSQVLYLVYSPETGESMGLWLLYEQAEKHARKLGGFFQVYKCTPYIEKVIQI